MLDTEEVGARTAKAQACCWVDTSAASLNWGKQLAVECQACGRLLVKLTAAVKARSLVYGSYFMFP